MKTLAQSLLTALLLSTATFAASAKETPIAANPTVATDSYKVAVYPSALASKLNVSVERQPGQAMTVALKDAGGRVLAQQLISKYQGNFYFKFDMAELQDGTYSVELSSGNDVTVYPVTLATQAVQASTRRVTLN